ncbi:3-oxoacyl-[acyl-carrier-protein] reductase FabG [Roseovarius albus]|uniref:3-oxoacyl-[acyl-carrier-protein] reductase FabG n=1 Tax=Roseovarius albus TaxID=1247867 RepID=A0A1X7A0A9_9RHOB|nr:SDR family NAD(P)-dependent oxidoreductase [Roseovarius albus]SLN66964.1 3-oxoacyl-[acyl-carrier-protein] reductase FabG [Roseovarius albus]
MTLADKVALVTGGGSGVGLGVARRLGQAGAKVAIAARGLERLEGAAQALRDEGVECRAFQVDLTEEEQIKDLLVHVSQAFGGLNTLVNNAGCGLMHSPLSDNASTSERWDFYHNANLRSAYLMTSHALPYLAADPGGAVVNISSTAAFQGSWGLYGVAKAGVEGLTRAFASEAAPLGIRVNCVSPGWIATSEQQRAVVEQDAEAAPPSLLNRMGTPEEIGNAVRFLASDEASFITGQTLIVDGGMAVVDYPSQSALNEIGRRGASKPSKP